MLKTATITWISFNNYGTCLQAYALQHYIESLGYENHIIDDSTIVARRGERKGQSQDKPSWKNKWVGRWQKFQQLLQANYRTFLKFQKVLCASINYFKSHNLNIYDDINLVLTDKAKFDLYICGSDQIWVPYGLGYPGWSFFYAAFTTKHKIAYGPSIGNYQIPDKWRKEMSELIAPFKALSVREEAGRIALQELTDQPVELVVDPTLLLSQQEWESVLPDKGKRDEKYVLGYILTPNERFYKIAREYANQHGLKFYLFMLNLQDYGQADKLISGGPLEFLEYVKNATAFFTDSYHGTIFSMIFETPFYTFKRFSDDSPINQNSRIDTLLSEMGAEARLIDYYHEGSLNEDVLDFAAMKYRMEPLIIRSKEYLQKHLSAIEESKG